eukprot:357827-Chlamydomonas_euryale.AAC.4
MAPSSSVLGPPPLPSSSLAEDEGAPSGASTKRHHGQAGGGGGGCTARPLARAGSWLPASCCGRSCCDSGPWLCEAARPPPAHASA